MKMANTVPRRLARMLMRLLPSYPSEHDLSRCEIFQHDDYVKALVEKQKQIQLASAQYRYDYEKGRGFFNTYFPHTSPEAFQEKSILDLGCFTGGRMVQWVERYNFLGARGIDVNPIYAEAGNAFAEEKGVDAVFDTGVAENMPYPSDSFDFIVSYDVFEHVQNIELVMRECFRILKPGGKLFAVFPPFFQPLEAHLGLVTKMPALHWMFSGKTITTAYNDILQERGREAYWYARKCPELAGWERLPSLNGMTVAGFRRIITENDLWFMRYWGDKPILSDGQRANILVFRILQKLFILPARLPYFEELFLGRICCELEKREVSESLIGMEN